jgi:transposase-like protein
MINEYTFQPFPGHRGLISPWEKFSTTNCIEDLNSQLKRYIGKVTHWKSSQQRYRWISSALLEIEQKMRKVNQYKKLYLMQEKLQEEIKRKVQKKKKAA